MNPSRVVLSAAVATLALTAAACGSPREDRPPTSYEVLQDDTITNADLWSDKPKMMAAGLGFTTIIGVPGLTTDDLATSRTLTQLAGGTWNTVSCTAGTDPTLGSYTSAVTPDSVANSYGTPVYYADGLPIEFSWPVLPSSVAPDNFAVRLNTGETVTPDVASIWPNFEYNERSVLVVFGHFGNRIPEDQPGAIYPTNVAVVAGETPLQLVGPNNQLADATGFDRDTPGSPYTAPDLPPDQRKGPDLVAAKLSRMNTDGDTGPKIFQDGLLPNDGVALYGDAAQYRLRVYTSGGMTPDGVRGMFPTDYERFFRVNAVGADGRKVALAKAGKPYSVDGDTMTVVGLADLGLRQDRYDDCYREDKDNYIDIVLSGDEAAMKRITTVEIPSTGEYDPLYNPGGPGNHPVTGVRYSSPTKPITQDVHIALDDPMTVTYGP